MLDSVTKQKQSGSPNLDPRIKNENVDELVKKAVKGDDQAFTHLLNRYYADIYRISFHLTKDKNEAEDLTHDASLKIAKSIHQFQFNSDFMSWVYRIVVNTFFDNQKKQQNQTLRDQGYHDQQQIQQRAPQADESVAYQDLLKAIYRLPRTLQITLILIYAEHLSHAKVAQILECSVNTVSWRVHEAKNQLKKILKEQAS